MGPPSYPDILRYAGAESMDIVMSLTDSDEVNMVACQVAYTLFKIPIKLARIRSSHYFVRHDLFNDNNLPIDVFVNPEKLIADQVFNLIDNPGISAKFDFCDGIISFICVKVTRNTHLIAKRLHEVDFVLSGDNFSVIAVLRDNSYLNLKENPMLISGDEVFILVSTIHIETLLSAILKSERQVVENVIIAGGNSTSSAVASLLEEKGLQVKNYRERHANMPLTF